MGTFSFLLRDNDGQPRIHVPPKAWVYFDYRRRLNDVGQMQGIFSTLRFPEAQSYFDPSNAGSGLDRVLDVHYQPAHRPYRTPAAMRLDSKLLLRYQRKEHTNDSRPRRTIIGRGAKPPAEAGTHPPQKPTFLHSSPTWTKC